VRTFIFHFQAHARVLFAALLGLVLGTALQLQQADLFVWHAYMAIVLLAPVTYALIAIKNVALVWQWVFAALSLGLLGFGATGLRATAYLEHALDPALEGRDVRVTGVVARLPQRNETGLRFRLQVESAVLDGQPVHLPPRLDVGWYGDAATQPGDTSRLPPPDLRAGERWQMTLRLKAPHGARNPHGFDYELYLWEQGVQATGYVRTSAKDPVPQRMTQTWLYPVVLARQVVRERIYQQVQERAFAGMLTALVVGDQAAIDRVDWDVFRATGVAHLVSISGIHVTMFAWGAALLVGWMWRRSGRLCIALPAPSAALMGGVLLAIAYAVFSGWGLPAQRTCLMLATVALLRLSGARWPWPHVWMLACAVVVASDPWALLQAGFWLSFVAVGILFATNLRAGEIDTTGARGIKHHMLSGLREQWVITVALTPLTLLLFGQVSLVGLVANALAIPWITLVVTPLALLGVVVPVLWDVAAGAVGWLYAYLQWLAAWPWASITVAVPPLWAGAAGVLGGLLLVLPWGWRMRVLGLPLLLPVLLWRAPLPAAGEFELLAADVGQGNAVLVRTANHALLYDAGPRYSLESDAGHRVLVPLLQALNTRLDTLVLSHRDMDHVGGAPAVLAMQPQAQLLSSIEASHPLQALRPAQRCVAGQSWQWDGVRFDVIHPQAADYDTATKSNAMSCVLRISNGRQTALLVGDIEQPQEARLVAGGVNLRSDLLLVPHHGSKTSSSAEFLDAVAPQIAIVQSGYRNRFGHPAAPVLERLQERNVRVVDSPHCGAFTWQSGQVQNSACLRLQGQRYWHHNVP
jgi:competence protein ComEC